MHSPGKPITPRGPRRPVSPGSPYNERDVTCPLVDHVSRYLLTRNTVGTVAAVFASFALFAHLTVATGKAGETKLSFNSASN